MQEIETDLTDNDRIIARRGVVRDKEVAWAAWGDACDPWADTAREDDLMMSMLTAS